MDLLKTLVGVLTGGAGTAIGGAVSWVAQIASLAAIAGPVFFWLYGHGGETAITFTYSQLAFYIAWTGVIVFLVVRLVHRAPAPG